ncbi:hypothetical protein ACJW31_12G066300 [Castanea mollissima]
MQLSKPKSSTSNHQNNTTEILKPIHDPQPETTHDLLRQTHNHHGTIETTHQKMASKTQRHMAIHHHHLQSSSRRRLPEKERATDQVRENKKKYREIEKERKTDRQKRERERERERESLSIFFV